jgi:hypothetical protein
MSGRRVLLGLGGFLLLVGLVWIGQGTGFFPYPRESFMIDQRPWAWRGGVVAVAGLACLLFSRRVRRV